MSHASDDWRSEAACKGKDPRHWFPIPIGSYYLRNGSSAGRPDDPYAHGRAICASCPVKAQCLEYALSAHRQFIPTEGLWGGLDEVERRQLLRGEKPARKAPEHGTPAGYKQHGRLGEKACDFCKKALARYTAERVEKAS